MQTEIEAVRRRSQMLHKPKVFCEEWPKPLIASQRWVAELIEAAGGEFVANPGAKISFEEVAAADPEVLVAAWCGARDCVPLEKTFQNRGWENTRAAQNCRVYSIRDEYLNTPALRFCWACALWRRLYILKLFHKPKDYDVSTPR
jgi:iron complex transport system substrate-binding protein